MTLIRTIDQWAKSDAFNITKLGNRIILYSTVFEIRPIIWNIKQQKHLFILLFNDEHLFQVEPAHPQVKLTEEQLQSSYISKGNQKAPTAYFLKEGDRVLTNFIILNHVTFYAM